MKNGYLARLRASLCKLTCRGCLGLEDFDVGLCDPQRFALELRLQRSAHRASADGREADVAAERTHKDEDC